MPKYHNVPPQQIDPTRGMFEPALGRAPGRGRMTGRRVLVVGAGQRIIADEEPPVGNGRAIARVLGREGAQVVCLDISQEAADTTRKDIEAEGGTAYTLVGDVTNVGGIGGLVDQAARMMGGLDGLVLGVGISSMETIDTLTPENWDHVFDVNVRSHMWFAKAALEVMEPGSSIVTISSRAGLQPGSRRPAYDVSKGAQYQLARTVALEGEPKAIRCNCVVIGLVDTPMGRYEAISRPKRAAKVPFGRQGTSWEVALTVLFMLSSEASYVNAQMLIVDGGGIYGLTR